MHASDRTGTTVVAGASGSIGARLADSLFIKRARAKGCRRQMVDLLGYARLVNALTLARCRGRQPVVAAA